VLMYVTLGITASITYKLLLHAENGRRDRGDRNEIIEGILQEKGIQIQEERNGRFKSVEDAKREKGQKTYLMYRYIDQGQPTGDEWSGYRYTL
jgi:hypothetical protein